MDNRIRMIQMIGALLLSLIFSITWYVRKKDKDKEKIKHIKVDEYDVEIEEKWI